MGRILVAVALIVGFGGCVQAGPESQAPDGAGAR